MTPELPHKNCYWVVPGVLMAGEYPGARTRDGSRESMRRYLECGVRSFIDLTEVGELRPYLEELEHEAAGARKIVTHGRFPIRDMSIPSSREFMVSILDAIEETMQSHPITYVHCWGGVGRTGTVVGCYFSRHGLRGDKALDKLSDLWLDVEKRYRLPQSPETRQQRDYVRDWDERR